MSAGRVQTYRIKRGFYEFMSLKLHSGSHLKFLNKLEFGQKQLTIYCDILLNHGCHYCDGIQSITQSST